MLINAPFQIDKTWETVTLNGSSFNESKPLDFPWIWSQTSDIHALGLDLTRDKRSNGDVGVYLPLSSPVL